MLIQEEKELTLLRRDVSPRVTETAGSAKGPLDRILCGNYNDVLNSEDTRRLLCFDAAELWSSWDLDAIATCVSANLDNTGKDSSETLLLAGVSALCLFVQANWTGPEVDEAHCPVRSSSEERARCVARLSVDGNEAYQLIKCPEALGVARVVFEGCQHRISSFLSFQIWRVRYCLIYQQVLDDTSPHLFNMFLKDIQPSPETKRLLQSSTQLAVEHYLTVAHVYNYYHYVTEASQYIARAQRVLNFSLEMVGVLGKRTYFQESRAQLALRVTDAEGPASDGEEHRPAEDGSEPTACSHLPPDLRLGDDTRLERVQYDQPGLEPDLSPLRQAVIFTKFFQELKSQGRQEIRDEQLLVMLSAVTYKPQIWAIQFSALLQRSRLESGQRRTVERAMTQTQALVDAAQDAQPPAADRLQLFFSTRVPSRWEAEGQLAARYLAMGVTKAALEVYERLQLWEEAIHCYHLLQQRQRAAEVVREQISINGETPKLLCLLGDATDDVTCYQRAWEMSDHKLVRAVRSEGLYYYHRKQYERCIPLLSRAVEINSLQFDVWSRLAYAALQTEDWKVCASAYRRCCYLEPENFEAWNNIAHAYIKLGQKERAWKTLQESLRFSFDNWKIWENFLIVSVDIGEFEEAINAYNRLSDIQERHVDTELLQVLLGAVLADTPDRFGVGAGRLRRKMATLFGKLTAQVTTNASLWSLYGDLTAAEETPSDESRFRAVQHYQKAHRCIAQQPGAEKQTELANQMLRIAVKLSDASLQWAAAADGSDSRITQTLASVKLAVRGTVSKVKAAQTDGTGQVRDQLRDVLTSAEATLNRVLDAIQRRQSS